jgi:hypothetical protein
MRCRYSCPFHLKRSHGAVAALQIDATRRKDFSLKKAFADWAMLGCWEQKEVCEAERTGRYMYRRENTPLILALHPGATVSKLCSFNSLKKANPPLENRTRRRQENHPMPRGWYPWACVSQAFYSAEDDQQVICTDVRRFIGSCIFQGIKGVGHACECLNQTGRGHILRTSVKTSVVTSHRCVCICICIFGRGSN